VLDLDVYIDVMYIMCVNYVGFVIPVVLIILFPTIFLKPGLIYDG
jgi:hypothetical protein